MKFSLGGLWLVMALILSYEWSLAAVTNNPGDKEGVNLIGQFTLRPSLALQTTHNDNINLTAENEKSDFISIISPSCSLEHSLSARGLASLGYTADYAYYSSYKTKNWRTNQLDFNANYESPGGIILKIVDSFMESEDPYGAANEYGEGEQKKRWSNTLNGKIGFDLRNRIKLSGTFYRSKQDYDDNLLDWSQDYKNEEYGLGIQFRIMPKTWFFSRYYIGETDYTTSSPAGYAGAPVNESNDADFSWKRLNAGFTTDPTSKIRGELNFGYKWKNYKNSTDSYGNLYDDKNTWIAQTQIAYLMSPKTKLSFVLSRALWASGSASNEFYESLQLGANIDHRFKKKLNLNASVNSRFNDYNTPVSGPKRSDDRLDLKLGLTYQINRWFAVSTKYSFADKDSNYSEYSYRNNRLTFLFIGEI